MSKRIRDYGIRIGEYATGERNAITDVEGVKVGHTTLNDGSIKTGVTAIQPHGDNTFQEKLAASSHVINGFGKPIGFTQIEELGTLETPIVLTNTLSVGVADDALIDYMLEHNPEIGETTGTVNPVISECNDSFLNDIRGKYIQKHHVREALRSVTDDVAEGAVGAGTGMSCFGLKGGIGTASRTLAWESGNYTIGVLVLSNYGSMKDFILDGQKAGKVIKTKNEKAAHKESDKGSIVVIVATDIDMPEHQLKRVIKRSSVGIARTGSFTDNGSGEFVIGFSTGHHIPHETDKEFTPMKRVHEDELNSIFHAVAEATEEAILNSLVCADTTTGKNGNQRISLKEYMHLFI